MSSHDEINNLVERTSPSHSEKKSWRRNNKVQSPPVHSPSSSARESDISNIFEVKRSAKTKLQPPELSSRKSDVFDTSTASTSEMSDEVFESNEHSTNRKRTKPYKDKIKHRFKAVKERAGSSSQKARSVRNLAEVMAMERVRKESNDINAEIDSIKSKYNLKKEQIDLSDFFLKDASEEQANINELETVEENLNKTETYHLNAEQMKFNVDLSEKEQFFYPNNDPLHAAEKITANEPRNLEEEGYYVEEPNKVLRKHINKIEKILLSIDDKKWFNCKGEMQLIHNPILKCSFRPKIELSNQNLTSYVQPTKKQECDEVIILQNNILEFHIACLKFDHHPLFSIEHVLEQKLKQLYEIYSINVENNNLQRLKNQLNALRHVKNNVENLQKESGDADRNKLINYTKDIKCLRNALLDEGKKGRETLKGILEIWKIIKKVREMNTYSNTNVKLLIKREKVDVEKDEQEYKKYFDETVNEILKELKNEYKENMRNYKKDLEQFEEENEEDRPEKPVYDVDEEKIKLSLNKQFQDSFRQPGEPIIKLLLTEDNEITNNVENNKEHLRKNLVNSTKFYLKIICNKLEVCKSKQFTLNDNFRCEINETFSILLLSIPKFITVELIEQQKSLLRKKICEINVPLPAPTNSNVARKLAASFKKEEIISYKHHNGVGSGVDLNTALQLYNLSISNNCELNISGSLQYSIEWESYQKKSVTSDLTIELFNDIIDKTGTINVDKFKEWIEQTAPDPQDPKNNILYEFSEGNHELSEGYLKNKNYFRLGPYVKPFKFCDMSEIDENIRLVVLQLRNQNEIEFDGMLVPNRIKELPANVLSNYKKRIADKEEIVVDDLEYGFESQRNNNRKYLQQIYTNIYQKCKNTKNNFMYEDVVDEKYLAYFQQMIIAILKNFINWFRWQPKIMEPLPKKQNIKEVTTDMLLSKQVNVVIKVIAAKNVPIRTITDDGSEENKNKIQVSPFVQVLYKDLSYRTSSSEGVNPTWNETIVVPLASEDVDYLNSNSLNGVIMLNLFDELNETGLDNNKLSVWLGSVKIPISAICDGNIMEGSFKIKLPQLLMAYKSESLKQNLSTPRSNSNFHINTQFHTYIELKISVNPNIPKLSPSMDELPYNDLPYIKEHITKWNELFNNNYPHRQFSALAIDTNGKTCCIVRYIKPIEPPQISSEEFTITADQCARYVSLIPFTECNHFYQNIWLKTNQLINLMIGSVVDHAIALTCFLLALEMNVWLLLGYGIPTGSTAYVLVQESNRETELPVYYIYDVVENEKYNLLDPYCPLQRIYCIVNQENLWANVQRNDNIATTRFDLSRRADWLPLFNKHICISKNSVQNEITYKRKLTTDSIEIQLEKKIKKKLSKLRQLERTVWNFKLAKNVKNSLRMFELNSMFNRNTNDLVQEIQTIFKSYQVDGLLINIPYESASAIAKIIKSYGVHLKSDTNCEFVLVNYIHSYGGQVLSVWLFLASISIK